MLLLEEPPEANKKAWEELRPLAGGIQFGSVKAGAHILATGPNNQPILVVQQYGKGRVLAFAADTTWRWALAEQNTAKYHKRFWRQVVLWLGSKENLGRANVWIGLQSLRVVKDNPIEIKAHVEDSLGRRIPNAKIQAEVTPPKGSATPLRFAFQEDAYVCPYRPPLVGDYNITLKVFGPDGKALGEDAAKFVAYLPDVELEDPAADPDCLRRLAAASGGAFYTADQACQLFQELADRDATVAVKRTQPRPLWGSRWVLSLFLIALALEWTLRKVCKLV